MFIYSVTVWYNLHFSKLPTFPYVFAFLLYNSSFILNMQLDLSTFREVFLSLHTDTEETLEIHNFFFFHIYTHKFIIYGYWKGGKL